MDEGVRAAGENRSPDGAMNLAKKETPDARAIKRYNVVLPAALYDELQKVAAEKHTTVLELIRKFVKLGLLAVRAETTPNLDFVVRENGVESRVFIL